MEAPAIRPYALKPGEGWTYSAGIDFIVKAGELGPGRRLAVIEYTTRRGEEPPDHPHPTEDEIFSVPQGALTFQWGENPFQLDDGGFAVLRMTNRSEFATRPAIGFVL